MAKRQRKSSGRMASKGFPNPIDVHVGSRIRLRRTLLGISQERLADAIGLTFQQVQKYEKGANRVSSSRLVDLANALDVAVPYFFDEMSAGVRAQTPSELMRTKQRPKIDQEQDPLAKPKRRT
ncbi:MAG: helix-turn-helix transcriptional regulator, partial [Rhodospirillales bacterium]|nr:helix-turn-helix transcriptional regulator [Rhodospirillales bacterium]